MWMILQKQTVRYNCKNVIFRERGAVEKNNLLIEYLLLCSEFMLYTLEAWPAMTYQPSFSFPLFFRSSHCSSHSPFPTPSFFSFLPPQTVYFSPLFQTLAVELSIVITGAKCIWVLTETLKKS